MSYIYKYQGSVATQFAATDPNGQIKISDSDLGLAGAPKEFQANNVADILNIAYFIAGMVAVLAIVIGGVRYAASNGDSSQVAAAKNMIMYAVVGLVIIFAAAAITQFVITFTTK